MDKRFDVLIEQTQYVKHLSLTQSIFLMESLRQALEDRDLEPGARLLLLKGVFDAYASDAHAALRTHEFYAPFAMRAYLASGDFKEASLKRARQLYEIVEQKSYPSYLDIHFFWQRLHGLTLKLDKILNEVDQLNNEAQLTMWQKQSLLSFQQLLKRNPKPFMTWAVQTCEETASRWETLPWPLWQYKHLRSLLF